VVTLLIVTFVLVFAPSGRNGSSGEVAAPTTTQPSRNVVAPTPVSAVAASTLLAAFPGPVARYSRADGTQIGTVAGTWYGRPLVSPVLTQQDGYLQVRLAQRPNGSTAWIKASAVTLESTPYRVVINVATRHLSLYKSGTLVLDAPAGIGVTSSPTPTGAFFLAFVAAPPSAAWGPFVMVTSAHSNAISDWEESGDAIVAIHGPLGSDTAIGSSGAQVSHGCVRLHVSDLQPLRAIPVGSPIDVVA
jgi:hypothetical protein